MADDGRYRLMDAWCSYELIKRAHVEVMELTCGPPTSLRGLCHEAV